jgi:hypothetical protein
MTSPEPTATIRQSDIEALKTQYRITDIPVAVRTVRIVEAGGFADADRNPNTWTAYLLVDGQWAQIQSARGLRREWTSLDRLERWLRSMGFSYFAVRNDIETSGTDIRSERPSMK